MNLVLRDPALLALLRDVHRILSSGTAVHVSFRKYVRSARRCCHQCHFCRINASLLELASLISRILASGYRELTVFIILEEERHLYSTFVLDYIQSFYALVIQTSSRYGADCGSCIPNDNVGVLNPNTHNLTILPVYDWRGVLERAHQCPFLQSEEEVSFLFVEGTPYIYDEFYDALDSCGYVTDPLGRLATCKCPLEVHRDQNSDHSARTTSLDSIDCSETSYSSNDGSRGQCLSTCNVTSQHDHVVSQKDPCTLKIGKLCSANNTDTRFNNDSTNVATTSCSTQEAGSDPPYADGQVVDTNETMASRMDRSASMPCKIALNSSFMLMNNRIQTAFSFCGSDDREILSRLGEVDCLAVYDPNNEVVAREILSFDNVMCCGTFDCLHFGHKYLLLCAFLSCHQTLQIGITAPGDMLHSKIDFSLIQNLEKRREAVEHYMRLLQVLYGPRTVYTPPPPSIPEGSRVVSYHNCDFFSYSTIPMSLQKCLELSYHEFRAPKAPSKPTMPSDVTGLSVTTFDLIDRYGPAGVIKDSFALVISPESLPGAMEVNRLRSSKGLTTWPLLSAGFVLHPASDRRRKDVQKVSSSWIRSSLKSAN
ncbi:bifunctional coenzyme A synthase-like, putative [Babesia ovis]|uniref:Bifunctional coenzyme A synthase-like, putative n=1 Tax=Babesia ovis TaxID=5869 RepID=A0A9W5T852_BABOV|nr:bifunctional coenzyme A synthase-like, putative [Babesia ovis]